MKRFFSIAAALPALFIAGNLEAMDIVSEKVTVPFEFKVANVTLPAGQYRIEREFGKQSVYVVNLNSGRRVHVMRDSGAGATRVAGMAFETTAEGYRLAKVF